jgi:hypothetical protein
MTLSGQARQAAERMIGSELADHARVHGGHVSATFRARSVAGDTFAISVSGLSKGADADPLEAGAATANRIHARGLPVCRYLPDPSSRRLVATIDRRTALRVAGWINGGPTNTRRIPRTSIAAMARTLSSVSSALRQCEPHPLMPAFRFDQPPTALNSVVGSLWMLTGSSPSEAPIPQALCEASDWARSVIQSDQSLVRAPTVPCHGDTRAANFIHPLDGLAPVLIDWSDSFLGPPWWDTADFLRSVTLIPDQTGGWTANRRNLSYAAEVLGLEMRSAERLAAIAAARLALHCHIDMVEGTYFSPSPNDPASHQDWLRRVAADMARFATAVARSDQ